ncbi:MAG: glycyl-radical enzyme activating protein [bacterium]
MVSLSAKRGLVFNIQKFCLHDGPGIRTAVFIKGCPLRCQWCANPESQSRKIQITWNVKKCQHCLNCMKTCPEEAISLKQVHQESLIHIDHMKCSGCQICVRNCPAHALSSEGEWKDAKAVFDVCMQDIDFYEESGGGVTLSGGEVLSSPEFAIALMDLLHEKGVHVALETSGFANSQLFERVVSHCDLLLFDMKHYDEKKHIEGTGVSNLPILVNMKKAVAMGLDVLPRIPVIPGYNDSLEDAVGIAKRLQEVGVLKAQLLPFHQFGENKYHLLDMPYAYEHVPSLHPEDLTAYREAMIAEGIDAFF